MLDMTTKNQIFGYLRCHSVWCLMLIPEIVFGHGAENHNDQGVVVDSVSIEEPNPRLPIHVGGPFSLTDHHGNAVTEETYADKYMLVFFGYTDCQIMCSISLKRIGNALALLEEAERGILDKLAPLIITVDPNNDTPAKLKKSLAQFHPKLIGLTGSPENLSTMYRAYNQTPSVLDGKMNEKDVVAHTSYFHLLGPDGKFRTLFPPILNAESMAGILKKYIL